MRFFRSIRFRIAAWSALISGIVVLVFSLASTYMLYYEYLETMDEELEGFGKDLIDELEDEDDFSRKDLVNLFDLFDDRDSLHLIAVVSPEGEKLFRSSRWKDYPLELDRQRSSYYQTISHNGDKWRFSRIRDDRWQVFTGSRLKEVHKAQIRILGTFALAFPLALVFAAGGGLLLAYKAMQPVNLITKTAEEIRTRGLGQRIPLKGLKEDELGRLSTVINSMLERLEASFEQTARFSADASHELNTPLTVMQGELESALQEPNLSKEGQNLLANLLEETQRLKIITRSLLLFSRSDAGNLRLDSQLVNLGETLKSLTEDAAALDSAQELEFKTDISESVWVTGDPVLLKQACHNLLLNAVRYNRENGWVKVSLSRTAGSASCRISNSGLGIAAEHKERIFDRFFREDPSRARTQGGFGLGLSLAREIIRAHGGEIYLEHSDSHHTTFVVQLPLSADRNKNH